MPWRVRTVVSERREFIESVLRDGANFSAECRRVGISRDAGYRWLRRYLTEGEVGLEDRSRRPKSSPRQTPAQTEALICELRRQHPAWGGRKLYHRLKADGVSDLPAPSTITDILNRNHLLSSERRLKRDWQRFEADEPNRMWQMDFKGDFATQAGRCYTLTVLDDHSRFNICLEACSNQRTETVREHLLAAFDEYGLPEIILVDNGPPWGNGYHRQPHTRYTAELIQLGIDVWHGKPYHPQTRGKDERFHRSLDLEVLHTQTEWRDNTAVQSRLTPWREVYNHKRPHQALAYAVPASRYRPSLRRLPSVPPPIEYLDSDQVRRVQDTGEISFRGQTFRIGRAFTGKPVALRAVEDGMWDVYFCKQRVGIVDLRSPSLPL